MYGLKTHRPPRSGIDGREVKVERHVYNRIEAGDTITVSLLSNGRHRFQGYGE